MGERCIGSVIEISVQFFRFVLKSISFALRHAILLYGAQSPPHRQADQPLVRGLFFSCAVQEAAAQTGNMQAFLHNLFSMLNTSILKRMFRPPIEHRINPFRFG